MPGPAVGVGRGIVAGPARVAGRIAVIPVIVGLHRHPPVAAAGRYLLPAELAGPGLAGRRIPDMAAGDGFPDVIADYGFGRLASAAACLAANQSAQTSVLVPIRGPARADVLDGLVAIPADRLVGGHAVGIPPRVGRPAVGPGQSQQPAQSGRSAAARLQAGQGGAAAGVPAGFAGLEVSATNSRRCRLIMVCSAGRGPAFPILPARGVSRRPVREGASRDGMPGHAGRATDRPEARG